eukprot:gene8943-10487_t
MTKLFTITLILAVAAITITNAATPCKVVAAKELGGSCGTHKDYCATDLTTLVCNDHKCIMEAHNGESCDKYSCIDTSDCVAGRCVGKKCDSDTECGLGYFCSDNLCIYANETTANSCTKDAMCPIDQVCAGSKCVKKYGGDAGSPCSTSEQCNLFAGVYCDKNSRICKKNEYNGKSCYVDSECGAGVCTCTLDSTRVCVGTGGAFAKPGCSAAWTEIATCITANKCSRYHPLTCEPCYEKYLCYQYNCFATSAYDPTKAPLATKCTAIAAGTGSPNVVASTPKDDHAGTTDHKNDSSNTVANFVFIVIALVTISILL